MSEHRPPLPSTILETCLYVTDLPRARTFYETLFGYRVMATDDRFCALAASGQQVLLLFLCGSDPHGSVMPFGTIPPHDGSGPVHIGFGIPSESLPAWRTRLAEHGIAIESTITWPRGGTSIYLLSNAGNANKKASGAPDLSALPLPVGRTQRACPRFRLPKASRWVRTFG
jgi:catechol 2,3-dioxygenase-like lactoylglutathione lyase family enzyme